MNKISQNLVIVTLLTLALFQLDTISASPVRKLNKRSEESQFMYHEKNICIMACGTCAEDDLNDLSEQVNSKVIKLFVGIVENKNNLKYK